MSAPALPLATSRMVGVASGLSVVPTDPTRVLPVHAELADLFPWGGLRRGSTIAVRGSTALLLALLAEATANGSWAAVVGLPDLGILAAAEHGVAVDRLALVPNPGAQTSAVIAALLDGVDLVAVSPGNLGQPQARRLSARARHRGAVLLPFGPWPAPDLELTCEPATWTGLGTGHGHLRQREVVVRTRGRGAAARPAHANLLLPGPDGSLRGLQDPPTPELIIVKYRQPPLRAGAWPDVHPPGAGGANAVKGALGTPSVMRAPFRAFRRELG